MNLARALRMAQIEPFHVMEVQERAFRLEAAGRRIVHMEIGQPDFGAPPQVVEAAIRAMSTLRLGYTSPLGLPELREAIAAHYETRLGVKVPPGRIAVTTGASGAFLLVLAALVGPGDEILLPDPCYPCSRHMTRLFEGRPVAIPVDASTRYQPTARHVAEAWRPATRGLILATPANPTGTAIAREELRKVAQAVSERRGFLIVDEIYAGLTYDGEPRTALELGEDVIVVNSFSKYFNMTGWRLGWIVAPEELVRDIEKLAQNVYVSPPAPAQFAALAAFLPDSLALLEERRCEFRRRRDFLVPALRSLGFTVPLTPEGAFYVYAGCGRFAKDSAAFAMDALDHAGVALTPGLDFGAHAAKRHVRFAYTRSMTELTEGVERLAAFASGR
jgi:aspartate/methionine/tyrosine aminotransferase